MKTEEKILLRSRMLFMEKGISGTQMTEIAESSGINRRTLYRYFPTKEHLVCSLQLRVSRQINDYYNRLSSHLKAQEGAPQLMEFFRLIDFGKLRELFYLQAQFDSHFSGPYPTDALKEEWEELEKPEGKGLYEIIRAGQENGTLRNDMNPAMLYRYLMESFTALADHIILKRSHLEKDWQGSTDFLGIYREGIRKQFIIE